MNEKTFRDDYDPIIQEFDAYIKRENEKYLSKGLPKGRVPENVYWLVDGKDFIGRISIRHKLNQNLKNIGGQIGYYINPLKRKMGYGNKILRIVLKKAKKFGLKKVLITCDETNIASRKIIENNGGILQNKYIDKTLKVPKLRYWIKIK